MSVTPAPGRVATTRCVRASIRLNAFAFSGSVCCFATGDRLAVVRCVASSPPAAPPAATSTATAASNSRRRNRAGRSAARAAAIISRPDWYRSSGSFASALRITADRTGSDGGSSSR